LKKLILKMIELLNLFKINTLLPISNGKEY
jgi:hypothetical protein